jgi:hypothetical protein
LGFGFPSRKTKKEIFYGVPPGLGIGSEVFSERPEHPDMLLRISVGGVDVS